MPEGMELSLRLQDTEPRVRLRVFESLTSNTIPCLEMRKHKPKEVAFILKSNWHEVMAEPRLEPRSLSPGLSYFHSLS